MAGFRIDLGVRHPDYPHGYLLGVECDGRTYHSALSVRDRDRLREAGSARTGLGHLPDLVDRLVSRMRTVSCRS